MDFHGHRSRPSSSFNAVFQEAWRRLCLSSVTLNAMFIVRPVQSMSYLIYYHRCIFAWCLFSRQLLLIIHDLHFLYGVQWLFVTVERFQDPFICFSLYPRISQKSSEKLPCVDVLLFFQRPSFTCCNRPHETSVVLIMSRDFQIFDSDCIALIFFCTSASYSMIDLSYQSRCVCVSRGHLARKLVISRIRVFSRNNHRNKTIDRCKFSAKFNKAGP